MGICGCGYGFVGFYFSWVAPGILGLDWVCLGLILVLRMLHLFSFVVGFRPLCVRGLRVGNFRLGLGFERCLLFDLVVLWVWLTAVCLRFLDT